MSFWKHTPKFFPARARIDAFGTPAVAPPFPAHAMSSPEPSSPLVGPKQGPLSRGLSELLLWLLLFLMAFALPKFPSLELDASWRMSLTYFLQKGYVFGRDVIFTYGPLGFLLGRTYTGDFLVALIVWQLFLATVTASLLLGLSRNFSGLARFCFVAFFALFGVGYEDAVHTMLIVLLGWQMIDRLSVEDHRVWVLPQALFFALLAAIKFTNLMLAGVVVVTVAGYALHRRRRNRAWVLVAAFAAGFLFLWLACRQPLTALPAYFLNSLDISSGYQGTMGLPTPVPALWKGCLIVALLAAYAVWHFLTQPDHSRSVAQFLILGAFLYLNWKHAFVRADGHMLGFFYSAMLVCLAFPALFRETGRRIWVGRLFLLPAAVLSLFGIYDTLPSIVQWAGSVTNEKLVRTIGALVNEEGARRELHNQLSMQRTAADLPKIRTVIGKASIDVLGFEQGVALLNRFNYLPRPVFQSYSAYTPHLSALNQQFYLSKTGPEYALLKLQTIDGRPLMLDDAKLLQIFPHYYRYVLSEKGFQLWRRRPSTPPAEQLEPRPLARLSLPIGKSLSLEEFKHQLLWAEFDLPFTIMGRIRNLLYKPAIVSLRVTDQNNKDEVFRLPLPAAKGGFIISPVITDIDGYLAAQGGTPSRWATSIALEIAPEDRRYFSEMGTVTLSAVTPSKAKPEYDRQVEREKYSMFSMVPDEVAAFTTPSEIQIEGHAALVMHAPSLMVFTPPPGAVRVRGNFGYPPGAYSNDGNTDGAEFRVIWATDLERRILFSKLIRPVQEPKDRGLQHFDVDLRNLPRDGHLLLEISPGPKDEHSWDWTAWSDVVIE